MTAVAQKINYLPADKEIYIHPLESVQHKATLPQLTKFYSQYVDSVEILLFLLEILWSICSWINDGRFYRLVTLTSDSPVIEIELLKC